MAVDFGFLTLIQSGDRRLDSRYLIALTPSSQAPQAGVPKQVRAYLPSFEIAQGAGSGDCGQGFRLNATMQSHRRRPELLPV
jgi:hypothetical protein